jgi:anti-anti-sigma regulatory factor
MAHAVPDKPVDSPELFTVEKGVLRAHGEMYWEYLEEFEAACARLLESRRARIEVDLTSVNFISSSFLGCLGNMVLQASHLGKRINLKVTLDISWLFDIIGCQKNMDLEVV